MDSGTSAERVSYWFDGALAQLVERLLCKQEVRGSIPLGSTPSLHRSHRDCVVGGFRCLRVRRLVDSSVQHPKGGQEMDAVHIWRLLMSVE